MSTSTGISTAVVGAGSFGTCLAMLCSREHDVSLYARRAEVADAINRDRRNPRHLSEFDLSDRITATSDLARAVVGRDLVVFAVPSHSLRDVVREAVPHLAPDAIIVSAVKGIEFETGMTMHQVIGDVVPAQYRSRIVCLSGPSFAREIAQRRPTVVTVACREEAYAVAVQATLSCPWFRCYSSHDVIGVEIGGALKNVIAIAVGMADGMEAGLNTRAALMTRGLAELTRLAVRLGAEPATLNGLSGMGDLVLTCTGDLSRNRRVGLALGRGPQPRRGDRRARRGRRGRAHHPGRLPPGPSHRRRAADRGDGPRGDRRRADARRGRPPADDPPAEARARSPAELRVFGL